MKYGIQLYSVRDAMEADFEGTVRKIAEMGYETVEFAGFYGKSKEEVKAILDECGLKVSSTHTGWYEVQDNFEETVEYHKYIGNNNIIFPGADLSTPEKLDDFIAFINKYQPKLAAEGIKMGYHNHRDEFKVTPEGYRIHDELAKRTNINFEIDIFWAFCAGEDPVALMEKYKDRIQVVHLKDGFKPGNGMALGEGEAPIKAVVAKAKELGIYCVVESETQQPDGPSEVRRCADWLKTNG